MTKKTKILFNFLKFFIIFLIIVSLYIFKDNIFLFAEKIYSSLNETNSISKVEFEKKKEVALPSKVDIPGALRVVDSILSINNKPLSNAGVISITNEYRKENGDLVQLIENDKLDISAEKKLKDMFANQYFEHISPSGVGVANLSEETGYEYILIGENLAMGNFLDDKALVDAWMASPGHRANILNSHYTQIGVAVGKGKFEGRNVWMAVQHFGTPIDVCPSVDKILLDEINLDQSNIQGMESSLISRRNDIDKGDIYKGSAYYNAVNSYNKDVTIYNNLLKTTKEKIIIYNKQINLFNECVLSKQ